MRGRLKFFDEGKKWGFLKSEEEGDIFVHKNDIEPDSFLAFMMGDTMEFEISVDQRGRRATNVHMA